MLKTKGKESKWKKKRNKRLNKSRKNKKGVFNFALILFCLGLFTFLIYLAVTAQKQGVETIKKQTMIDENSKLMEVIKEIPTSKIDFEIYN